MAKVKLSVQDGPSVEVEWVKGMNVQQVMEEAWFAWEKEGKFTYTLQYFGKYAYMVTMINGTYDSFISTYAPYYYWEFLVNGKSQEKGIDETILNEGDHVSFSYSLYVPKQSSSQLTAKHEAYQQALATS